MAWNCDGDKNFCRLDQARRQIKLYPQHSKVQIVALKLQNVIYKKTHDQTNIDPLIPLYLRILYFIIFILTRCMVFSVVTIELCYCSKFC